jgi:hypothetical protein
MDGLLAAVATATIDNYLLVRVQFGEAGVKLAQRYEGAGARNGGNVYLKWFAYIQQERPIRLLKLYCQFLRRDRPGCG